MFRKFLAVFLPIIILLFLPISASAHLFGQPAFTQINGKYTNFYHVLSSSSQGFVLPQDEMPENYLVGQTLNLNIDASKLPVPAQIVQKTKFTWDFADGARGQGMTLTHIYNKQGSYILMLFADDGTTPQPQLLDSILVNILPTKTYQLPKSQIFVNEKSSSDPLAKVLIFDFSQSLKFDGSKSSGSGLSYFWDFGDTETSTAASTTHTYGQNVNITYPLLRVKDNNGFIADSFVEIDNKQFTNKGSTNSSSTTQNKPNNINWIVILIAGGVIIVGLIEFLLLKFKKK